MRKAVIVILSALLLASACGKKKGTIRVAGYEIDSVVVDTTVALVAGSKSAPTCQLALHLHYLKEKKAQVLNDTLLRAGILLPDYFSLSNEKLTVKALVDSFVGRYIEDYLTEYAPLYKVDQEHATAYNVQYDVRTHFEEGADGVLTHLASIYTYGGGMYGIRQTLALNIDTKKAQIVRLADIIIEGCEQQVKDIVVEAIMKKFKAKSLEELQQQGIFADGETYLSENFILGKDALTFIYGEDEIAPHSVGEIRVEIDKDDLKKYLR